MSELVDLVVVGAGPAGRVAALESAKLGLDVVLLVDPDSLRGALASGAFGGVTGVDFGAESFSATGPAASLAAKLGVELEELGPRSTRLVTERASATIPDDVRAGIPANPFARELRPLLKSGLLRAYADRVMPFLRIGPERNLARLVSSRLGTSVLEGLTRPFTRALWALDPELIDADRAVPGVNAALTRFGSLQGAMAGLIEDARPDVRFAAGASALAEALDEQLGNYLVQQRVARAISVVPSETEWLIALADGSNLRARAVIVAADPASVGLQRPASVTELKHERLVANALVRWPGALPERNRTGVLFAEGALRSIVRPSLRSAALAAQLSPGVELVRASFDPVALDGGDARSLLIEALQAQFGERAELLDWQQREWSVLRPWLALGDPERGERIGSADNSLEVAGQWVAGPGLDSAVRSGHEVAHRVRRVALQRRESASGSTA